MAQKLTEYLNIEANALAKLETFNPILKVDSKFFIDPKALKTTSAPEFKDSYTKVRQRCKEILDLLAASSRQGDLLWQKAYRHFPKGEVSNLCIGYGFDNISGRGIGPVLTTQILLSLKEFLDTGINDPALFEIVGVFQEGIGSDFISDFIARVILEDICIYTDRISKQLTSEKKPRKFKFKDKEYAAFRNPFKKFQPVLLIPEDILQPLPVASDWSEIDIVCQFNEEVRRRFTQLVGYDNWKSAIRYRKPKIKKALLSNTDAVQDLLSQYNSKPSKTAYNYSTDPLGEYSWQRLAKTYTKQNPLKLDRVNADPDKVVKTVKAIIEQYKQLIENNGLWINLYTDQHVPMHERHSQKLFYGIADSYCEANNLDISPETDSGHGPIDFKFSNGRKAKVLVELKLTKNSKLAQGLNVQLREYGKAEKPYKSFLLVISITHKDNYLESLNKVIADKSKKNEPLPEISYVDATIKESASKLKA